MKSLGRKVGSVQPRRGIRGVAKRVGIDQVRMSTDDVGLSFKFILRRNDLYFAHQIRSPKK